MVHSHKRCRRFKFLGLNFQNVSNCTYRHYINAIKFNLLRTFDDVTSRLVVYQEHGEKIVKEAASHDEMKNLVVEPIVGN